MRKLGFKLSIIEAELNLLDAYKKKSVFQPKTRLALLFIREFSKYNHTQLFCWIFDTYFVNLCSGWTICHTLRILHILFKKNNSKSRWGLSKEIRHKTLSKHNHTKLFCWILDTYFVNLCWGWIIYHALRILHILGKNNNSKSRWGLSKEIRHKTHHRLHAGSNFCSKPTNLTIWLFLQ